MTRVIVRRALAVAIGTAAVSLTGAVRAQVIYEPIQYQFGNGADRYYYGGASPLVHAYAERQADFVRQDAVDRSVPAVNRQVVYTGGTGYHDAAADFGRTPTDARNEAYANASCYFRKADVTLVKRGPGVLIVPATAEPLMTPPAPALRPTGDLTPPGTVLLIRHSPVAPSVVVAQSAVQGAVVACGR